MKGDVVPAEHHVSRLCGGSHVREDGTIAATAFKPRPGEAYLSVSWLEYLHLPTRIAEITEVRRILATKRSIGTSARLAVLNVGAMCEIVRQHDHFRHDLVVRHEPEDAPGFPQDLSHSGIYGVPEEDNIIPELLAGVVAEVHAAR